MTGAQRDRRIAELEEQHAHFRAAITERGGLVPLDARMPLARLEAELRLERLAKAAAAKGHPDVPNPGDVYYVTALPRPGAKSRGRRNLRFEHGVRRKVEVVDGPDADIERRILAGESIASAEGMLEILGDDDLIATRTEGGAGADELRARNEVLEGELEATRKRASDAEAALAAMKAAARRDAPDPNDGSPGRLKAAAKAADKAKDKEPDKG
jgi:hypothetical protein